MTSTEIATQNTTVATAGAATDLVITADQTEFTTTQVAALKQLGIQDATEGDLQVFFHQAKRTGLDPFAKQIYMIGRKTKTGGYRGEPERWETKWTIQTGIDGYRLNGARAAKQQGIKIGLEGPFFRGLDGGGWDDVWLGSTPPAAAKYTIIKDGEPITGIAMYSEFVQTKNDGKPNSMWAKMPANQLAKCAEAQAWRKAFPDDFSGVVLEDAAQGQVIDGSVEPQRTKAPQGRGVAALEAMAAKSDEPAQPSEPVAKEDTAQVKAPLKPTKKQADELDRLFADANIETDNWSAKYIVINRTVNRDEPVTDIRTLTRDEVADLITTLGGLQTEGVLVETVENMLIEDAQSKDAQQ